MLGSKFFMRCSIFAQHQSVQAVKNVSSNKLLSPAIRSKPKVVRLSSTIAPLNDNVVQKLIEQEEDYYLTNEIIKTFVKDYKPQLTDGQDIDSTMFHPINIAHETRINQDFSPVQLADSDVSIHKSTLSFQAREGQLFGGMEYMKLPIVTVHARWNNTIIDVRDSDNSLYIRLSSRTLGYKNAKKKTELACEETGREGALRAMDLGCPAHVRVIVKGIGRGRRAAIFGLGKAGMILVSIGDESHLHLHDEPINRPRKIRRL